MLGPFATTSRLTPIHQMSLAVLSRAACASMSTTTTTTTTRDRGVRYGPVEWAQLQLTEYYVGVNCDAKQEVSSHGGRRASFTCGKCRHLCAKGDTNELPTCEHV